MDSSLKERFARLGPVRDVDRVTSGSPAAFRLQISAELSGVRTVDAMHVLARRGLSLLRAKRCVEALIEHGRAVIALPVVESGEAVAAELLAAGVEAASLGLSQTLDVRAIRAGLGLTREQFALRYGLEAETLKNWETGKREPDTAARSYLHVISNAPGAVEQAYAQPMLMP